MNCGGCWLGDVPGHKHEMCERCEQGDDSCVAGWRVGWHGSFHHHPVVHRSHFRWKRRDRPNSPVPIAGVEVSIDGGSTWASATLEGEAAAGVWQVFRYRFTASAPGPHQAMARATDKSGKTQPQKAVWNPSGYFWNAWHAVRWEVKS